MERLRLAGHIRRPTRNEIIELAAMEYMTLTDEEAADMEALIDQQLALVDRLDDLPVPELPVRFADRDKGYRPTPEEDPFNAFIRKCRVVGAAAGKLKGKTVAVKDNICVASIPMTNGSTMIRHFVPDIDATVVERVLDAGATIVGKLNMDNFALSATSETSAYGCVRNPHNPEYSAGGSTGGAGAAVASGVVDIALAVDQGGSARIPASWCGTVSMKATHGLVPSFGSTHEDHTNDCICPMAKTVAEVALALEVIAGEDPNDPQWVRGPIPVEAYSTLLEGGVRGLRLGVVKESLDPASLEDDVGAAFRGTVGRLQALGAEPSEVSLPMWNEALAIWTGFGSHSLSQMIEADLETYSRGGFCNITWQAAFGKARRTGSDLLPPMIKVLMVLGKYLRREYCGVYFSKAHNLRIAMRQQFLDALDQVDVLLAPTMPMKAPKLGSEPVTMRAVVEDLAVSVTQNTFPLNVTGLPALTVPCGRGAHDLPIGFEIIGKPFAESLLFRVGHTLEQDRKPA